MSQGTFKDTLIRLEAFKTIFVFCRKSDFFLRLVHGFWSKMTKFSSQHFSLLYAPRDLGVS